MFNLLRKVTPFIVNTGSGITACVNIIRKGLFSSFCLRNRVARKVCFYPVPQFAHLKIRGKNIP